MLLQLGFPQEYVVAQFTRVCLVQLNVSGQGSLGAEFLSASVAAEVECICLVSPLYVPDQRLSVGEHLVTLAADLQLGVLLGLGVLGEQSWLVVLSRILFNTMELFLLLLLLLCFYWGWILGWGFLCRSVFMNGLCCVVLFQCLLVGVWTWVGNGCLLHTVLGLGVVLGHGERHGLTLNTLIMHRQHYHLILFLFFILLLLLFFLIFLFLLLLLLFYFFLFIVIFLLLFLFLFLVLRFVACLTLTLTGASFPCHQRSFTNQVTITVLNVNLTVNKHHSIITAAWLGGDLLTC